MYGENPKDEKNNNSEDEMLTEEITWQLPHMGPARQPVEAAKTKDSSLSDLKMRLQTWGKNCYGDDEDELHT